MSFDRIHYSRTISNIDYSYSMCCGVVYVRFSTVLYSIVFENENDPPPKAKSSVYTVYACTRLCTRPFRWLRRYSLYSITLWIVPHRASAMLSTFSCGEWAHTCAT